MWYSLVIVPLLVLTAVGVLAVIRVRELSARVPFPAESRWGSLRKAFANPLSGLDYMNVTAVLFALSALGLWARSLQQIDTEGVTDFGLVSVFPVQYFAALGLLTVGFCIALQAKALNRLVVTLQLVVITLALYGTPALLYSEPRGAIAFRHAGLAEMISRSGYADPMIDAYTNWPGFFSLNALLSEAMGFDDALALINWSPLAINLVALGLIGILVHSLARDRRIAFLAMWFFLLGNWFGQDYFSPQAFGFVIYLALLALLLAWFARKTPVSVLPNRRFAARLAASEGRSPTNPGLGRFFGDLYSAWNTQHQANLESQFSKPAPGFTFLTTSQRILALLLIITLFAAVTFSHQVTPVAILLSVAALVMTNRVTPRGLPAILTVMMLSWWVFMASTYFDGHLTGVLAELGSLNQNVQDNVIQRLAGGYDRVLSAERELVLQVRVLFSAGLIGLAALGFVRRIINGYFDFTYALLAIAPATLLILGSHGGEIVIRAGFFSLPFISVLAASLFIVKPDRTPSLVSMTLLAVVSMVLVFGLLVARYGNERMDHFTSSEVAAVDHVYEHATPGSLILAGTWNTPWLHSGYEVFTHEPLADVVLNDFDLHAFEARAEGWGEGDVFVVLTRSQRAHLELLLGEDPAVLDRIERELNQSSQFHSVLSTEDAAVFQYVAPVSSIDHQRLDEKWAH